MRLDGDVLSVGAFLPDGYVTDGTVSYQREVQDALDAAGRARCTLLFPPMVYRLDGSGLTVRSHTTLWMVRATFQLDAGCRTDGQAFAGHDLEDVQFRGGRIVGRNDVWLEGVNVRGIYLTGQSQNVRIRDVHMAGLSSNGIGVFGRLDQLARDVWVTDVVIENGSNRYGDYVSERPGPEPGSRREDQGLIAFYYVQDFLVRGSRFEGSRSDATHFYRCRRGQFVHNKVYGAQMGGYFLETCEHVTASDNVILDNGSRGVTIERGSRRCTLANNLVANSGRDGLWAPNCCGLIVTGNVLDRNGRKPNGGPGQVWNANVTIDGARHDPTGSPTEDYVVSSNILYTTASQIAAMRIDAHHARRIVVKDNLLCGENRQILVQGQDHRTVTIEGNEC